jgi:hypothetical protein
MILLAVRHPAGLREFQQSETENACQDERYGEHALISTLVGRRQMCSLKRSEQG